MGQWAIVREWIGTITPFHLFCQFSCTITPKLSCISKNQLLWDGNRYWEEGKLGKNHSCQHLWVMHYQQYIALYCPFQMISAWDSFMYVCAWVCVHMNICLLRTAINGLTSFCFDVASKKNSAFLWNKGKQRGYWAMYPLSLSITDKL